MKQLLIIALLAGGFLTLSTMADDASLQKTADRNYASTRSIEAIGDERLAGTSKATDVIGAEVKNYQDEKTGKVSDLLVDLESGRIVEVVLSVGGLMGVGDTLVVVPPASLHYEHNAKVLHVNADKEKLKGAPKFESSNWNQWSDTNRIIEIYRYYGEEPYFAISLKTNNTVRTPKAVESMTPERTTPRELPPSYILKATKLIGYSVKNLHDEKLGKVEDLIVGLSSGRIVAVIVSSGGFLGIGDELSAVPPAAIHFNSDRDVLLLDVSRETLSQAPHFKSNQWPDLGERDYTAGVYRAYRVEPWFSTNSMADDTARNVRDRDERTLTPGDQGNSEPDVDTTRRIRKEIVAHDGLSLDARNVKIITANGRVTLRGPVKTPEEKRLIGEIAARIAPSSNVDNQLEVKTAVN